MKEPIIVYPDAPEHFDSILDEDRRARLGTIGKFSYFEVPATDADEFLGRIANAHVIILGWGLPAGVIERATHLELISFTGVGVGNFVDLQRARAHNIAVTNTPGYADVSAAEHTLGLILALARNLSWLDRDTRAGGWSKYYAGCHLARSDPRLGWLWRYCPASGQLRASAWNASSGLDPAAAGTSG